MYQPTNLDIAPPVHRFRADLAVLLALLSCPPVFALPPASHNLVWTAPAQPRTIDPVTLVFTAEALEDLDPTTGPSVVRIDPTARIVVVDLDVDCAQPSCVLAPRVFRVEIPRLPEPGTWTVHATAERSFPVEVEESVPLPPAERIPSGQHSPAEGFWYAPSRPGTGLHLQLRKDDEQTLLAVAVMDFAAEATEWRIGVAPLRAGSAAFLFHRNANGSCFGCNPFQSPQALSGSEVLRLRFSSARRAVADLGDGTFVELINMPWGAAYATQALGDNQEPALPLPELAGHWILESQAPDPGDVHPEALYLCPGNPIEGGVEYLDEDKQFTLRCLHATQALPARCELQDYTLLEPPIAMAALGDIEEERMRFKRTSGPISGVPFVAVRVHGYRAYFSPMPPDFCTRTFD